MQEGFSSATELGRCGEVRNGGAGRRLALSEVRMLNSVPDGWSRVGVGDFNGDAIADIAWRDASGTVTDWLGGASGQFTGNWENAADNAAPDWRAVGVGDFNGDGRDDILWRNDAGDVTVSTITDWLRTASGGFDGNWTNAAVNVGAGWTVVGVGDFNGDGRDDVLWRDSTGTITDWLGTATGGISGNWDNSAQGVDISWQVAAVGDFDGDGRSDILWRNDKGEVTDWLGAGDGGFVDNTQNVLWNASLPGISTDWSIAGVGDFNGDGRSDILWRNDAGQITDWLGTADGSFVASAGFALDVETHWRIAGTGDFNGDGRDDILWRRDDGSLDTQFSEVDGTFLPTAQQLWEKTLARAQQFFDEIADQLNAAQGGASGGADQNSYYDDGEDHAGFTAAFGAIWGWPDGPLGDFSFADAMANVNANFQLQSMEGNGFTASFNDPLASVYDSLGLLIGTNLGSINLVDPSTNTYLINVGGSLLLGSWEEGAPPADAPAADIVVTGYRNPDTGHVDNPTGYFLFDPSNSGGAFDPHHAGGSSPLSGYQTPGVSDAANLFASQHIHKEGTTAEDELVYERAHDALAELYKLATENPSTIIDIGHGLHITALNAILNLNHVTINIVDTPTAEGANTTPGLRFGTAAITLNPQNPDVTENGTTRLSNFVGWINWVGSPSPNLGIDFTIFHELGHALYDLATAGPGTTEAMADSAAFSMMDALQISYPDTLREAVAASPTGGLDD